MPPPSPEPTDIVYHVTTAICVVALILIFSFGSWLRSYVAPPKPLIPWQKQIAASLPVGLLTMSLYAKNTFPILTLRSPNFSFDVLSMIGYVLIMGMLSRETLDRVLRAAHIAPNDP